MWSPDGQRIAFRAQEVLEVVEELAGGFLRARLSDHMLFITSVDGTDLRKIGPATRDAPVWSSDGTRIAYVGEWDPEGAGRMVYTANPDGSNKVAVLQGACHQSVARGNGGLL